MRRARERMADLGVDVLCCSVGADLPYLIGYEAMPLERLTMLVVPREGDPTLIVPNLEVPRVVAESSFSVAGWGETDDPIALVAARAEGSEFAIGDRTWSRFTVQLQQAM